MEMDSIILHEWFYKNNMILNSGECHYNMTNDKGLSHKIFWIIMKSLAQLKKNFKALL